ncbi:hypothetical protein NIES2101_24025 [Calothrix sp. HK-06]|nr:hypothetical protein NIES2101_23890 [Calothrix sp. HK-06]OKH47336.1 hypothetical protein NIES2101_24025 [Calothrix sp. HK-06]
MQHNYGQIWRRHGSLIVFGVLVASSLSFGYKDIQSNMQSLSVARQTIASNENKQRLLDEQFKREQQASKIAQSRYKSGCVMVVAANSPRNLATLVEGEPVLDRTTKNPLPLNTVVCDGIGNTGTIVRSVNGLVVGNMAFTGNRELAIDTIKKIRGAKVYYVTPSK